MTWQTPDSYTVGEVLTSASMNKIGGDLSFLHDLLWDSVDSSATLPAASVTTASLDQTYTHLYVVVEARSASASPPDRIALQFNSDTAANYDFQEIFGNGNGGTATTAAGVANTSGRVFLVPGSTSTANRFGSGDILIPNYSGTSNDKNWHAHGGFAETATANSNMGITSGTWRSTAAITTISFLTSSASNIAASSRFTVYGRRG